jgi:hypothetical protein
MKASPSMAVEWFPWPLIVVLLAAAVFFAIYRLIKAGVFRTKKAFSDALKIAAWFSFSTLFGQILVFLVVFVPKSDWSATGVAELWAMACLFAGGALGFLFGIPKSIQPQPAVVTAAGKTRPPPAYAQRVNTSLEEVSDWLTKLLLGIGLVQLQKVPGTVRSYAAVINAGTSEGFGIAIIVYFSVLGFLGFYLVTRLYLQRALGEAASMGIDTAPVRANLSIEETIALKNSAVGFGERERELSGVASKAAKKLLAEVDMDELESAHDFALWGKAQLNEANYADTDADKALAYKRAVEAYRRASQLGPSEIEILQEYSAAIFLEGMLKTDWKHDQNFIDRVRDPLMKAYRNLSPGSSYEVRKNLYKSLTWITLYAIPPEKFKETIRLVEEYERDPRHTPSGTIKVNLACALGHKMKALKADEISLNQKLKDATDAVAKAPIEAALKENNQEQAQTRLNALDAIKAALVLDPTWTGPLIEVLVPSKDRDDDLTEFEKDNDFRQELGLPRV